MNGSTQRTWCDGQLPDVFAPLLLERAHLFYQ